LFRFFLFGLEVYRIINGSFVFRYLTRVVILTCNFYLED